MIAYVVDASVVAEYLLRTRLGLTIGKILEDAQLIAPELLDAEVLSVLRRAVLTKRLAEERAQVALDDFQVWPIQRMSHSILLPAAWRYINQISAYDAMYVATAHLHQIPLVTADGPLSRAPGLEIVIKNCRIA